MASGPAPGGNHTPEETEKWEKDVDVFARSNMTAPYASGLMFRIDQHERFRTNPLHAEVGEGHFHTHFDDTVSNLMDTVVKCNTLYNLVYTKSREELTLLLMYILGNSLNHCNT